MILRIVKIFAIFLVSLFVVNYAFSFGNKKQDEVKIDSSKLFARNIGRLLNEGNLVVVDDNESDKFIQENLSTHDLKKSVTFARIKSEMLERPLYIENKDTYGKNESVAKVIPTERKAWQTLTLEEIRLKYKYALAHPNNKEEYKTQEALDPEETPKAMADFINAYPDSSSAATALSHIEFCLVTKRKAPDKAIKLYEELKNSNQELTGLCGILDTYIERAEDYKKSQASL